MSGMETRKRYKRALAEIAAGCEYPEEVALEAISRPAVWKLARNLVNVGDKFCRLETIYECGRVKCEFDGTANWDRSPPKLWICICDCGTFCTARQDDLVHYNKRSCGCLRSEMAKVAAKRVFRKGKHWSERLASAVNRIRRAAREREEKNRMTELEKIRKRLERRPLIPYAGKDRGEVSYKTEAGSGWKYKGLGLENV